MFNINLTQLIVSVNVMLIYRVPENTYMLKMLICLHIRNIIIIFAAR
jgi:hypothetical protein